MQVTTRSEHSPNEACLIALGIAACQMIRRGLETEFSGSPGFS
jgi:hypothetical protein